MMEHAAIQGTFADLKSVKTRSVVQMVVEIPIEQAEQIVRAFGFPQPGAEIAVAVARLNPEKAEAALAPPEPPAKPKKRFHELPLSQQAALRCLDARFRAYLDVAAFPEWLAVKRGGSPEEEWTRRFIYGFCNVQSRAELDTRGSAGSSWMDLNARYEQWTGLATEPR